MGRGAYLASPWGHKRFGHNLATQQEILERQYLEIENKYRFNLPKKQVMQQPSRQDGKQPFWR